MLSAIHIAWPGLCISRRTSAGVIFLAEIGSSSRVRAVKAANLRQFLTFPCSGSWPPQWPPETGLWGRRSRSTRNYGGLALPGLPGISQTNIHFGLSPVQKQNALRRKCISGLFCISQRHARIHIYLNNYSEWRKGGNDFHSLSCCPFYDGHTNAEPKGFYLQTSEQRKKCRRIALSLCQEAERTKDEGEWGVISRGIDKRTRICSGIRICFARLHMMRMMMSLLLMCSHGLSALLFSVGCPAVSFSPTNAVSFSVASCLGLGTWDMHKWLPHKTCYLYLLLIVAATFCLPFLYFFFLSTADKCQHKNCTLL